jgi:hypothetical protein
MIEGPISLAAGMERYAGNQVRAFGRVHRDAKRQSRRQVIDRQSNGRGRAKGS